MEKKDILNQVIDYTTQGNKAKFARLIGVEPQTVSGWYTRKSIPIDMVEKILRTFPSISADFLVLGQGRVQKDFNDSEQSLTFQNYISYLKELGDKSGASSISNEFITEDGYRISIKVEKNK